MAADYDRFSRQFKKSREFPFRTCIEEFMILQMLGNLSGLTALDLACGERHYARMLRRHRAARVIGVDISEGIIALAREEEAREPLGVEFVEAAVEDLSVVGVFDAVSAVYLLHYAPTRQHLAAMCRTIAANLQPGGRRVAINSNFGPGVPVDMSRYGWKPSDPKPIEEGMTYRLTFRDPTRSRSKTTTTRRPLTKKSSAEAVSSRCSGTRRWSPLRACSSSARITGRISSNWRRSSASSAPAESGRPALVPQWGVRVDSVRERWENALRLENPQMRRPRAPVAGPWSAPQRTCGVESRPCSYASRYATLILRGSCVNHLSAQSGVPIPDTGDKKF
jgi:hypothetical protein